MSWKEFLKPNWRKIGLTILFIILLFIFSGYWLPRSDFFWIQTIMGDCLGRGGMMGPCPFLFEQTPNLNAFILIFVLGYLISCLIICIYDKVKKK